MEGEWFFMLIGSMGISMAGFAALVGALSPGGKWDAVSAWRVRMVMSFGFSICLSALAVIPIFMFTQDVERTVRFGSAGTVIIALFTAWAMRTRKDTDIYPRYNALVFWAVVAISWALPMLNGLIFRSTGLLMFIYLYFLFLPMTVFINIVRELTKATSTAPTFR
ncbi:MAG: hypothetical protein OEM81_12730 [Acidimicrobiia bacterium]|nr:hypothetical protein [Acidimicrobiia bacterium]MDH3398678.1 hypothetical protein [Acidimicrobiia bacterium]